jgi:hypothetical protein
MQQPHLTAQQMQQIPKGLELYIIPRWEGALSESHSEPEDHST